MTKTVFPSAIKSRPVYGTLSPRPGTAQLFVADDEGAGAIIDLAKLAPDGFFERANIIFVALRSGEAYVEQLKALNAAQLHVSPTFAAASPRLRHTLSTAHMGLQIYLAGTEGLMGQAMQAAIEAGIPYASIQTEHRGATRRRLQCVHCKGITEDVTQDPFQCSHCGLHLFVRDHYSRRIAAFQGVRIDAEDTGNIPTPTERFT
jgi:dimethylamine monooxygenase subunit C